MTTTEIPWPWPGDTELDKRTRICHDYRRELRRLDRDMCDRMDAAAHRLGQHWVSPIPAKIDLEAKLSAVEMSRYLHDTPSADVIRQWGSRHARGGPGIPRYTDRDGHTVYRVADILDYLAQRRKDRIERKATRRA